MTDTDQTTGARTAPRERARRPRLARVVRVLRTERVSASLVRLVVGGPGLAGLEPPPYADAYLKVLLVPGRAPGWERAEADRLQAVRVAPDRLDVDALTALLPPEEAPRMRSYTVRRFEPHAGEHGELSIDFVVHGSRGLAGPWAARAAAGDELVFLGPGGDYVPDPRAGRHLMAGDLSALPAIAAALEQLARRAPEAVGDAVIEVPGDADELALEAPAGLRVTWVRGAGDRPGRALVPEVRALPWPDDDVQAFVHGEAGAVRELRRYLRLERGLGLDRLSVSGYWRLGVDDEGWRAGKREWNAAIEQDEAAGTAPTR